MKHLKTIILVIMSGVISICKGQERLPLGSLSSFQSQLETKIDKNSTSTRLASSNLEVALPDRSSLALEVNYKHATNGDLTIVGKVKNHKNSSFIIEIHNNELKGNIVLKDQSMAYVYFSNEARETFIETKDINNVICVGYKQGEYQTKAPLSSKAKGQIAAVNDLQSLPGAPTCVLLDFDGYYLPPGTGWLKGESWTAPASNLNSSEIQKAWEIVSEDFRPFNVNITTSEAVYNTYAQRKRQRCVFTPDDTPYPNSGGVAFVDRFGYREWPCWVFNTTGETAGEAASHEVGHTLGLSHDGRTNPKEGYFRGHGDWAPIMGVGYYKDITQWSKGEYNYANNTENDLAIMTRYINYRNDDHGNNFSSATSINTNDNINQPGVIEKDSDVDMFAFTCGSGNISLDINTVSRYGNLNILAKLYEASSGNLIGTYNNSGLNTSINTSLAAGTYYLGVEGTGSGNPATNGYSGYGSLGSFTITGNVSPAAGVVTVYEDCNYNGYAIPLPAGRYNLSALQSLGISNDDISSIRVQNGYQAILYWDNNFRGKALLKTGDDNCLRDDEWNDKISSLVISTISTNNFLEAEKFNDMSGVKIESCSEGGQNVGYIETGDWMAYFSIPFPSTGNYLIEYRVASKNGGGVISADLDAGSNVLGTIDVPSTGGWQKWQTVSHSVSVNAGTYNFGIYAQSGGWNINWIKITPQSSASARSDISARRDTQEKLSTQQVVLFPNPTKHFININNVEQYRGGTYTVMDKTGKEVLSKHYSGGDIDVSNLPADLYFIKLENDKNQTIQKFIKQ
ncbi:carbohydrate-binding protein [Fulvivirga sediminis]|uniref:Carbohydrate-binding protein n=1 Tax=Fulvivirga sediminis TaxID=2803949 RepID=A0A937F8E2_9BACT|nr:carbohydrate-binding protein [Fulvivirga sediminis]MBL3657620.1 carbohydrate-binding protein [Fulvivirga sediminis]